MTPATRSPLAMAASPRNLLAAVLLLAATGAGLAGALAGGGEATAEPVSHEPRVAVWSARRFPVVLADSVGDVKLPLSIDAAVRGHESCVVFRRGSEVVVDRSRRAPLIPASTQKLLVGAAALEVLGPDHRFETRVVVPAASRSGVVERLWIVGGGDPVLMVDGYRRFVRSRPATVSHPASSLEALADDVVAAGVRRVAGPVLGDASRHADGLTIPTWKDSYITDRDVSLLSALTVNGGWSSWEQGRVTAPDPARNAAAELSRLLVERGVEVEGEAATGPAPGDARVVARVGSPPTSQIVEAMIRESDNLVAELLLREIGAAALRSGTSAAGAQGARNALGELGVDVDGVSLTDGSGLDRGNRATCASTAGVLELRDREGFEALDTGLAVAGRTGTLHRRMRGTTLEGRLRAKTGSLAGVVGLVGVLDVEPERSFALLVNGDFGVAEGAAIQDAIAAVVGAFPFEGADPDVLGPPPALRVATGANR